MTAKIIKELYEARDKSAQNLKANAGEDVAKFAYHCGFLEGLTLAIDIINMEMNKNVQDNL